MSVVVSAAGASLQPRTGGRYEIPSLRRAQAWSHAGKLWDMELRRIGVIGAGTMGNGIAQVFAHAGFEVRLVDAVAPALDRARSAIAKSLGKFVEKEKITAEARDAALGRLSTGTDVGSLADVDYVVEAIIEDLETKRDLFGQLDVITRPEVILSSNTSSISITLLGAATKRPDKVLGMHFMNPVPLMTLVELIRGQATSPESMATASALCVTLGKTALEAADYPGFIANRILMPMINEAIYALMEGVGTRRSDRRRNEARNEPSDGSTHSCRLHRSRRLSGDPERPARRSRRSEVPSLPAAQANGRRRSPWAEDRPRLLQLLKASSASGSRMATSFATAIRL